MKLSVIVPVYNESNTVAELLRRVASLRPGSAELELVVVNDGSTDRTPEVIKQLAESWARRRENPGLKIIHHATNRGKGAAIRTGIGQSTGDVIVIQDADLEYDPRDILNMLDVMIETGAPVVYGSRILGSRNRSYLRYYLGGRLLSFIANIIHGTRITDEPTCYKMFRKEVLGGFKIENDDFAFCPEVTAKVARAGHQIREVPVSYTPRSMKEGKKIRWTDGAKAVWVLLKYRFWKP